MQLGHIHINTERVESDLGDESIVGNLHKEHKNKKESAST